MNEIRDKWRRLAADYRARGLYRLALACDDAAALCEEGTK